MVLDDDIMVLGESFGDESISCSSAHHGSLFIDGSPNRIVHQMVAIIWLSTITWFG